MSEKLSVKNVVNINKSTLSSKENWSTLKYLDTGNITENQIDTLQIFQKGEKLPSRAKRKVEKGTIIYSTVRPNQKHFGYFDTYSNDLVVSTGFATLDVIDPRVNSKYLYYLLTQNSVISQLQSIGENSTSSYPSIRPEDIGNLSFMFPDIDIQNKIANILSAIDDKIQINNQINQELEAMAKTLYGYWFVQFDFPDQNGKPYKSSGGKMVYNQELKREIPEGWGVSKVGELQIATGKRDANFGTENGKYDFWTTANSPIKADEFSFEGKAILIAGNGNFYVNFTEGKFEAYQRTYVIQSEDENMLVFMYMACLQSTEKLRKGSNGSIIKYITIGDVNNIASPYNKKVVDDFVKIYSPLINLISKNKRQNQELTQLRDWLLPMLMNGQVKVK